MTKNKDFILTRAQRIIKAPVVPDDVDSVALITVNNPDQGHNILGPIFISADGKDDPRDVKIYIQNSFDNIPHIKRKIVNAVNNPHVNQGDVGFDLATALVKKNDYDWTSLAKASLFSSTFGDILFGALGESLQQSDVVYSIDKPYGDNDDSKIILGYAQISQEDIENTHVDQDIVDFLYGDEEKIDKIFEKFQSCDIDPDLLMIHQQLMDKIDSDN